MKSIIDVYSWRTKQLEVLGSINNLIELTIKGRNTGSFELTIADHVPQDELETWPYKSVEIL